MNRKLLVFIITGAFLFAKNSSGQTQLRTVINHAFRTSEVLEYRVHYGFIDAGEARLEIEAETKPIGPRTCYHVIGTGKTKGADRKSTRLNSSHRH